MTTQLTRQTILEELLRGAVQGPLTEDDALLWMVVLHTHAVHLRPGVLGEAAVVLPAETQRDAAATIAALWPNRTDPRARYEYWYWQYNTRTPYEALEDVPEHLMPQLREFPRVLAQDPRVLAVIEAD